MADAVTAMSDKEDKNTKKVQQQVKEKPVVETPKAKEKTTLPDGTVIETF